MAYGDKYIVGGYNPNGAAEVVTIAQWGWTGGVTDLQGLKEDWWELTYAVQDFGDPLPLSEARLRVVGAYGSVLAEIQGSSDAEYRVTWTTGGAVRWFGYIAQQDYRSYPYRDLAAVEVRAVDGIGLLADKLYDPAETIKWGTQQVARILERTAPDDATATDSGLGSGLVTRMEWVPWAENELAAGLDYLNQIIIPQEIFQDASEDRQSTCLAVLRQVAGRFGCRVFQSGGRWFCVQPHRYRPGAAGTVDVYAYADGDAAAGAATGTATALAAAKDGDRLRFLSDPGAEQTITFRTREAVSVYDFEPDLNNLVRNGGFEDAGATPGSAQFWTLETGAEVVNLLGEQDYLTPSAADEKALKVSSAATSGELAATQEGQVSIPGGRADLTLRVRLVVGSQIVAGANAPEVRVQCGDYYLVPAFVALSGRSLRGEAVSLFVEPLLDGVTDVVAGEPAIAAGTTLVFEDTPNSIFASATLVEPAAVGDTVLTVDLDTNVDSDDFSDATFYTWLVTGEVTRDAALLIRAGPVGTDYLETYTLEAPTVTPYGIRVDGAFSIEFLKQSASGSATEYYVPNIVAELRSRGDRVSEVAYQAALATGAGVSAELPSPSVGDGEWLLGDGPTLDSFGALSVRDSTATGVPTLQGADTGWKVGPYSTGEASSGRTIDALHAAETIYARGVPLERWSLPIYSEDRDGAAVQIDPEHVLRHRYYLRTVRHAFAGADYVELPVRVRVGDVLTIKDAAGNEEEETVTAVEGHGPFRAEFSGGTLSKAYPLNTRVEIARDLFWDRITQQPGRGLVVYEGTEQYLNDALPITEQILQQ